MIIRSGFISNSSSTSFLIISPLDLSKKENYDKVTDHSNEYYEDAYKQFTNPDLDFDIIPICEDNNKELACLYSDELDKPLRDSLLKAYIEKMNNTYSKELGINAHCYFYIDDCAQGADLGFENLFTDKNIHVSCKGFY